MIGSKPQPIQMVVDGLASVGKFIISLNMNLNCIPVPYPVILSLNYQGSMKIFKFVEDGTHDQEHHEWHVDGYGRYLDIWKMLKVNVITATILDLFVFCCTKQFGTFLHSLLHLDNNTTIEMSLITKVDGIADVVIGLSHVV